MANKQSPEARLEKICRLTHYDVDYDYDSYWCDGCYGCNTGDDYCRGAYYEGLRVTEVPDLDHRLTLIQKDQGLVDAFNITPIKLYAIGRIVGPSWRDLSNWGLETEGGYYGEEIESLIYSGERLYDWVNSVAILSDLEAIKCALVGEYSHLSRTVKNATSVEEVEVGPNSLLLPVSAKRDYLYPKEWFSLPYGYAGIVTPHNEIVDGMTRVLSALQHEVPKVKVILIK